MQESQKIILTKPKRFFTKKRFLIPAIFLIVISSFILYIAISTGAFQKNLAAEVAAPIERELIAGGAKKTCYRDNNGKDLYKNPPYYYAQYEISGDSDQVAVYIKKSLQKAGYSLVDGKLPPNPADNLFYEDITKDSPFADLEPGKIDVSVIIFGSSDTIDNPFCVVQEQNTPPSDHRVVRVSVGLPKFKE